jgi:hypothetical protein
MALVAGGPRLAAVTLTGPGGIGKTRLALAVAQQLSDGAPARAAFRDGVFFVDLAPIGAAAQLVPTTAAALNFRPRPAEGGRSAADQLLDYLRGKQLLLVLDNFEHLAAEGAPWLADLLREAPGTKALVTSREPLDLQGEQRFAVEGLPVPGGSSPRNRALEEIVPPPIPASGARAQAGFRVTDPTAGTWTHLPAGYACRGDPVGRQLGGGSFAGGDRGDRGRSGFLEHVSARRARTPRSLRAVIEPSWQRLSPADRDAFARLCLCRGGFPGPTPRR